MDSGLSGTWNFRLDLVISLAKHGGPSLEEQSHDVAVSGGTHHPETLMCPERKFSFLCLVFLFLDVDLYEQPTPLKRVGSSTLGAFFTEGSIAAIISYNKHHCPRTGLSEKKTALRD